MEKEKNTVNLSNLSNEAKDASNIFGVNFNEKDVIKANTQKPNFSDTRSKGEKISGTKQFKKQLKGEPGTASFALTPQEKRKQTLESKKMPQGISATTGTEQQKKAEQISGEISKTAPKSQEEMIKDLGIARNKYISDKIAEIEAASETPLLASQKNKLIKDLGNEFDRQNRDVVRENIKKRSEMEEAIQKGKEAMVSPTTGEAIESEDDLKYKEAQKFFSENPNADVINDPKAFAHKQFMDQYEHNKEIDDIMKQMGTDDRNAAESFLAQKNRQATSQNEEMQRAAVKQQRQQYFQNLADKNPKNAIGDFARGKLAEMEERDRIEDFLTQQGYEPHSAEWNRYERQAMADYQRVQQLAKAQRKQEAIQAAQELKEKQAHDLKLLKMIGAMTVPWIKNIMLWMFLGRIK